MIKPKKAAVVKEGAFDIFSFSTCIAESRKKKRSTSIQHKTAYLDDPKAQAEEPAGKFGRQRPQNFMISAEKSQTLTAG